jgi:hypothetical protein
MTRGAVVEVRPYLFQRGQTLTWPRDQKLRILDAHKIDLVINLWLKVDPDLSGECRYVNWPIPGDRVADDIDDVVELAVRSIARHRGVLVHCEAGKNRSAFVCALVLARTENTSGAQAWERLRAANPSVELRPALRDHLLAVLPC